MNSRLMFHAVRSCSRSRALRSSRCFSSKAPSPKSSPARPYAGLTVVALEQAVAAPYCTSRLAASGARVIKVERRGVGDFCRHYDRVVNGLSSYWVWLNRGKESLELDIKREEDNALLQRLVSKADIFIENLLPGAAARSGFGASELRKKYPSLITCSISGYGSTGEFRLKKAYDLLVQAETGLCSVTGTSEGGPGRVGVSVCDIAAGTNALTGIQNALYHRANTGEGASVEVSLFDGMADWMSVPLLHQEHGGKAPPRVGLSHPSVCPYGVFTSADGVDLVISIQNEREWKAFCTEVLRDDEFLGPKFDDNSKRVASRPEVDKKIQEVFGKLSIADLEEKLMSVSPAIAYGIVNTVERFSKHPHLRRAHAESPSGQLELVDFPIQFIDTDDVMKHGEIPTLGQHNESIRAEFS